jgi:hypothetical protein
MPKLAVYLFQHPDYCGPDGFVSIDAEDAPAAYGSVLSEAKRYDADNGTSTYVQFAMPIEAALSARSNDEDTEDVIPAWDDVRANGKSPMPG